MEVKFNAYHNGRDLFHFERQRLNHLLMDAARCPMVLVCAGAGYGKTSAVRDFIQTYQSEMAWIQLSERDNVGARFWENYTHVVAQISASFAKAITKFGFPDTPNKLNQFLSLVRTQADMKQRIIVMDDFHFIEDPVVIRFVEQAYLNMPPGNSLFLISRSTPCINTAGLVSRGLIFNMGEDELRFTENELAQYFRQLDITLKPDSLHEIMQDTEGWAFAINLIARSYRKAPGYEGYLRNAMKTNIFRLMETEIWDGISERLQRFLVRLSLIDHLSVDLISLLAGEDKNLISELERQNAYASRDNYINAYLIHPLFLEFLATKEGLLSQEQKRETYAIAADWCNTHGFKIDAMSYYEKIGDYKSIVNMFISLPTQIPQDIASYATRIFERAPVQAFDTVEFLSSTHVRSLMCQGLWKKALDLAEHYEAKLLKMPKNDPFRSGTLASLYYCWAITRGSMCLHEDIYDFDLYFEKLYKTLSKPIDPGRLVIPCPGPWICGLSSARQGAPEEYIAALRRTAVHVQRSFNGLQTGEEDLAWAELNFYKGDINTAETYIARALDSAHVKRHFEIEHRALFYTLRIAALQGDYPKAEKACKRMSEQLDEVDYFNRFVNYDISLSWYYYILDLPEEVPEWIQENFSPYCHAGFIENFANQAKARFCYMTRSYPPLLAYIQEMRQRESYLFGRLEMLAMEACIYYRMKDKNKACAVLTEAYETAAPNELLMPFIELGKDMRTLTAYALKEPACGIPKPWLESINRKSASCAKRRSHFITEYKQAKGMSNCIVISPRETEVLTDLSHGLSRNEIATGRGLSINTVKMVINSIYFKLGAENMADAIRIATERRLI